MNFSYRVFKEGTPSCLGICRNWLALTAGLVTKLAVFFVAAFSLCMDVEATHIKGAYLGWERTGNVNKPNEIKFIVRLAYDRSAFLLLSGTGQDTLPILGDEVEVDVGKTTLRFADPSIPLGSPDEKIEFEGGSNNLKVVAVDAKSDIVICEPKVPVIHDYITAGIYQPFIEVRARDTEELAIRAGSYGKIPATINTTSPNRAPSIPTLSPLVVLPKGIATFAIPAVDPDGDTLTFKIASEPEAGLPHELGDTDLDDNEVGGNVPGLSIDPLTGVITWDTTNSQQIAFHYPVQVIVQDHESDPQSPVKSSVAYEILMWANDPQGTPPQIVSSLPAKSPIAIPQTAFTLGSVPPEQVYPYAPSFFSIEAIDDDIGARIRVVATNLPAGAVFYSQRTYSVESNSYELWNGVGGTVIQDDDIVQDRLHHSAKLNAAFIWNPSPSQLWQQFTITAYIEDDDGRRTPDIQFTVIGVPPVIRNTAAQFTGEPTLTSPWNKYEVKLEPQVPTFSVSFDSGPHGMADRFGTVYWTPMGIQTGKHYSYYFVSDGNGHTAFLPMRWAVRPVTSPEWWFPAVIDGSFYPRDYAAATIGQVRNIAQIARSHFQSSGITSVEMQKVDLAINRLAQSQSFAATSIGQLKAISAPFYEIMSDREYILSPSGGGFVYPWNQSTVGNYAMANIGQVKSLFSFSLSSFSQSVVASPVFNPNGGISVFPVNVMISNTTSGSRIYYTVDGTDPTPASLEYTGPFLLSNPSVVKAIGTRIGWSDSEVSSAEFTSIVATPEISPSGGAVVSPVAVTISTSTANSALRYTTDGTFPSNGQNGQPLNGTFVNASTTTFNLPISSTPVVVRAIASRNGWGGSAVASVTFTQMTLPAPNLTPEYRGVAAFPVIVGFSNSTAMPTGTTVRYTTNGSDPTITSNIVPPTGISIPAPLNYVTVKARAFLNGATPSPISAAEFHKFAVTSAISTTTQTSVNLSTTGTTDWIHWGDPTGFPVVYTAPVRKSGVAGNNQIGTYSEFGVIGGETVSAAYTTDLRPKTWTDGTPTLTGSSNKNGRKITRTGLAPEFGFNFTAPAIASARTLKIYAGGFKLTGRLVAKWSDTLETIYVGPLTGSATAAFESLFSVNYVAPPSKVGSKIVFTWQSSATVNASDIKLSGATLSTP